MHGGGCHQDLVYLLLVGGGSLCHPDSGRCIHVCGPAFELQPAKLQWCEAKAALPAQTHTAFRKQQQRDVYTKVAQIDFLLPAAVLLMGLLVVWYHII